MSSDDEQTRLDFEYVNNQKRNYCLFRKSADLNKNEGYLVRMFDMMIDKFSHQKIIV